MVRMKDDITTNEEYSAGRDEARWRSEKMFQIQ